jgi:hypothetical protein
MRPRRANSASKITVLMGSLVLGEGELRQRLFWAAVMLVGVVVLATP